MAGGTRLRRRLGKGVEEDFGDASDAVTRLRRELYQHHGVNVPARDPICTEYTMFARVVEDLLAAAREDRADDLEDLRTLLQGVGAAVAAAVQDAGKPLAQALEQHLSPQAIADQVTSELVQDLNRTSRKLLRDGSYTIIAAGLGTTLVGLAFLWLATEQLVQTRMLLEQLQPVQDPSGAYAPEDSALPGCQRLLPVPGLQLARGTEP